MIDTLVDDLKTRGRYDYVICDSVLNSVDSVEAEWSVLTVLKGLCKAGGSIFFSGRSRGELETVLKQTQAASSKINSSWRLGRETTRECSGQRDITCMISSFSAVRALETLWIGPNKPDD